MYKIGEALIGSGNEIAHVDLIIGDKEGPAGTAFANGLSQLSLGHTPVLSVIRPNLMTKPATLIVPKVTVGDLKDAEKIFGPAQAAVGRAVADAVEEGLIPEDHAEDLVLVVSVFIHPEAEDYRKIYQYNYGATRLAIRRAMGDYPTISKVLGEKDRGSHPIMGFGVVKLWNPPYLQVALDLDNMDEMERIINSLPDRERILLEAGTPLVKKFGVGIVSKIRELRQDSFIIADLKTLDVGRIEVKMAADETADAVAISGLGTTESIEKAIHEAQKQGIYSILDMMNVENFVEKLKNLDYKPDIVLLHRNVDLETLKAERGEAQSEMTEWGNINEIKELVGKNGLVAVAGGITPSKVGEALDSSADIIVVGRYIIGSRDVRRAAEYFLDHMPQDPDTMRLALDEDESL
ncbi:MAG: bifunctional 5,6,7,8-tetrahydromethanopterin hydro-lyase/3-hexulose-6-phosphate synthase [Euryarchaeota archaeon]|nr:bifunctional 5,6,7,8-tetrahydromethanopterin hydro-lyase/3-hexulose-6-phosphate synthase [Euryarchaeota archaeon]MBU4607423.1 bifunctional 5,6,7,8-tetrahydromethanopterin hydro-lyase/3-hexulose-6-phosphate synthase [Euryarchaeota archaeon]MBV1730127.1 bifunctional 5,6,7,8-tetrahydromethanopterin hydro-lyase/3-hexulose-6-phosphate synthase [Methanobacterium sp.]MBV1754058.1 bifunctional 5,6,7,8-tetrahydromethanopterin hydro-lyase/3-hexulose-6-phosphate synthase [Methanobacterium sp.]